MRVLLQQFGSLGMNWLGRPEIVGPELGQRYVSTQGRPTIWEVVDVSHYGDEPIPHVRLARVGAPQDTKTVSAAVLRDRRHFKYISAY
jgi:hypothetical protein